MDEFFSVKAAPNGKALCIGPLTRSEAPEAVDAGLGSGTGIYLYLATDSDGIQTIDVLAKVASQEAASVLSRLLAFQD